MTDEPILKGHKRVKKRFIPPMMQIPKLQQVSFVDDILPELIWLGLINDRLGFVQGSRFFEKIVLSAVEVDGEPPFKNYALCSELVKLDDDQRSAFLKSLDGKGILEQLRDYIAPLLLLYDNFPLAFIGPPSAVYQESELVQSIKDCTGRHLDKYKTPGIILHGSMLLARLVAGTISLPKDGPDYNAVLTDPDSEDAKRAEGFMRANALSEYGMLQIDKAWAQHFWNTNFELSECEFNYEPYV